MSLLTIEYARGGLFLPGPGLWLDPCGRRAGGVVVSHAHSDHIGAHDEFMATETTAALLLARLGGKRSPVILPFGEARECGGGDAAYRLTLLPAGHILGSAMALIEAGGSSLLYTGDFKLRPGLCAEPCAPRRADVLVMETTFGRPAYRFPPASVVMGEIVRFCRETVESGATPVLLAYSLGKSQELLRGLAGGGLPVMLHASVQKMTRVCEQLGQSFPVWRKFEAAEAKGHVLIFPPQAARTFAQEEKGNFRTAVATGWAVDPRCKYRYGADAAFPLSDHADFDELIEFVRRVSPRKIYTVHGFAADFAQTLRDLGYDAHALSEPDQLHLALGDARESGVAAGIGETVDEGALDRVIS